MLPISAPIGKELPVLLTFADFSDTFAPWGAI
jgi:hypothetical protein